MPEAPNAIKGSVSASSPENTRKLSGTIRKISTAWATFPEASLTPMMLGISANRASVLGSTLEPVRPGTLYTRIGKEVHSANAR